MSICNKSDRYSLKLMLQLANNIIYKLEPMKLSRIKRYYIIERWTCSSELIHMFDV